MSESKNSGVGDAETSKVKRKANPVLMVACFVIGVGGGFAISGGLGSLFGALFAPPPEKVQAGLKAQEYLDLGKRYKQVGWTEQARESLNLAIKQDAGETGKKAQLFLNAYVPRYEVTKEAVQQNILGFNQMAGGKQDEAIATFKQCIKQYPKFEWPYGNLGSVYTERNQLKEAKEVLNEALRINPHYVNGWIHLAEASMKEGDLGAARTALNHALESDPESIAAKLLLTKLSTK